MITVVFVLAQNFYGKISFLNIFGFFENSSLEKTFGNGWVVNNNIENPLKHLLINFGDEDYLELGNRI